MLKTLRILALLGGATSLGCTGDIGAGSGGTSPEGGDKGMGGAGASMGGGGKMNPPVDNTGALDDAKTVPGPAPLRRLTTLEYDNTIRDLLGVANAGGSKLTPDQGSHDSGF